MIAAYPGTLSETVETQFVRDFCGIHSVLDVVSVGFCKYWASIPYGKILFVGKDQEKSITEFIFVQHALEFFAGLDDTISVVRVDNEDDTLGVLEVMPPQRSNLVLPTHVPHSELDVLVLDSLDVET